MTTIEKLRLLNHGGFLNMQPSVSPEILNRIRDGVSKSRTIKAKFIDILLEQDVIE